MYMTSLMMAEIPVLRSDDLAHHIKAAGQQEPRASRTYNTPTPSNPIKERRLARDNFSSAQMKEIGNAANKKSRYAPNAE